MPAWEADDPRKGTREAQERLIQEIARAPKDRQLVMNDPGTVFCAYSTTDVTCFAATTGKATSVGGLSGISEVELGWATLGGKSVDAAACARDGSGEVRCWDVADSHPTPAVVR